VSSVFGFMTLKMAETLTGNVPPKRLTKEELVRTHQAHVKKQDVSQGAPRQVKQPMLEEKYGASTRSIRDLELVLPQKQNPPFVRLICSRTT